MNTSKSRYKKYHGDLTSFAAMLGDRFSLQVDWLGQIIGDSHHPSIGTYKENLLRQVIRDYVPKSFGVGTGFVLFPNKKLSNAKVASRRPHDLSQQLDIIVFDESKYPVVFQDGDFVILRPESVRAIVEVKGTLSHKSVNSTMSLFNDYRKKWQACKRFYSSISMLGPELPIPQLFALAWSVQNNKSGRPSITGKGLHRKIIKKLSEVPLEELSGGPLFDSFFVYNNYIVAPQLRFPNGKNRSELGFFTSRGKFVRYNQKGEPELSGDLTIASLLSSIHSAIDVPRNSAFSNVDQGDWQTLPHQHDGFDYWLINDEIESVTGLVWEVI